jgi:hypothetical protein
MRVGESVRLREAVPEQPLQSVQVQYGKKIVMGDRVSVNRDGWRHLVGMYCGKNYKKKKLEVRFEEFGGAFLLCHPQELRRISVVGKENVSAEDVE